MSQTFVYEPPAGIKASLTRSLSNMNEERMNSEPTERSRLYFLLAWFHATVIERLQYVPVGWSKTYEFSETDLQCALSSFDGWIDGVAKGRSHVDPEEIPWDALHAMLGQSLYGGRVDNEFDQRLLDSFVRRLFCVESFGSSFELAEGVKGPEGTKKKQFVQWVDALPNKNSPTWLGLPGTAEDMLLASVGVVTLRKFLLMQDSAEEKGGEEIERVSHDGNQTISSGRRRSYVQKDGDASIPTWILRLRELAKNWLMQMPKSMEKLERDNDANTSPLFRCFDREVGVGRTLVSIIRNDVEK